MEKVVRIPTPQMSSMPQMPKVSMPQMPTQVQMPAPIKKHMKIIFPVLLGVAVILAGIGSGWLLSKKTSKSSSPTPIVSDNEAKGSSDMVADDSVFPDSAEGTLLEGGIDGEGSYHLDRGTGEQKFVYLTSSVLDLQKFVGKKVEVWGETLAGKKAGWLMDVGKVKVTE